MGFVFHTIIYLTEQTDMQEKFLTEKIKFLTEWFRLLFAMLILLSGGLATVVAKGTFLENTFEFNLLKVGTSIAIVLFLIIAILAVKINAYIKQLKEL